ncbi:MAG: hypothetical protein KatS3mg076_0858 [Candidatus Binatia bacterium]|nr:MAG: hypothetical protein KatS3mg076_0858 [Candidatus Binatia bacterium]
MLLVCLDAVRADELGSYGAGPSPTPHLDALARESLVFSTALSTASWTKPAVASLLTGLQPWEHGVFDGRKKRADVLPSDVPTLAQKLSAEGYGTAAFVENDHLRRVQSGFGRGFETYVEDAGVAPVLVDRFLGWLEAQPPGKPFFAYLHFLDAHWPYTPDRPPPGQEFTTEDRLRRAHWALDAEHWWVLREAVNSGLLSLSADELATLRKLYRGEIAALDAVLGRLFRLLEHRGVFANTVVVVTADHGDGFLEHGRVDHGYGPYEELLRVPLLVRLRGKKKASGVVETPVQITAVAPSVLEAAGAPADGPSLLELAASGREKTVFGFEPHGRTEQSWLRSPTHKYIRTSRRDPNRAAPSSTMPGEFRHGIRVRVEGILAAGRFVAGQVKKLAPGDTDCEVTGPVGRVAQKERTLELLGSTVLWTGKTRFRSPDSSALEPLRWVKVEGRWRQGRFEAREVRVLEENPQNEIELEGMVGTVDDEGQAFQLCGRRVELPDKVRWEGFGEEQSGSKSPVRAKPKKLRVSEELYDLASDPREQTNLAATDTERLAELRKRLEEWERDRQNRARKAPEVELDPATERRLRLLGYVD